MAIYGLDLYGAGGQSYPPLVDYDASPFVATAVGYGDLEITWNTPTGDWSRIALVRNRIGYPIRIFDGVLLFEEYASNAFTSFHDVDRREGVFYYYALFVYVDLEGKWKRVGTTLGLTMRDWDYPQRLYNVLPAFMQMEDEDLIAKRYLSLPGYELDVLRTEAESLLWSQDPQLISANLLPVLAQQVGVSFEPELGVAASRDYVGNAIHLYRRKGTRLGINGLVTTLSQWAAETRLGKNLVLDQNDSYFEESIGRWAEGDHESTAASWSNEIETVEGAGVLKLTKIDVEGLILARNTKVGDLSNAVRWGIPVEAGTYSFSAYFRARLRGRLTRTVINWYDSNGDFLSKDRTSDDQALRDVESTWIRTGVTASAPEGARYAGLQIEVEDALLGEDHYVDALQFEKGEITDFEPARDIHIQLIGDRINFIYNPSFETGTKFWEPLYGSAIYQSNIWSYSGNHSLMIRDAVQNPMFERDSVAYVESLEYARNVPRFV